MVRKLWTDGSCLEFYLLGCRTTYLWDMGDCLATVQRSKGISAQTRVLGELFTQAAQTRLPSHPATPTKRPHLVSGKAGLGAGILRATGRS